MGLAIIKKFKLSVLVDPKFVILAIYLPTVGTTPPISGVYLKARKVAIAPINQDKFLCKARNVVIRQHLLATKD